MIHKRQEGNSMTNPDLKTMIPDFARRQAKYAPVAERLQALHGAQIWGSTLPPMDELISCVLSQSTSDANRDRGFAALKRAYPTWEAVRAAPVAELVDVIRPAGLANQKAPRIQEILTRIHDERGAYDLDFLGEIPIEDAKAWLQSLNGVGPKTAAIVLCFAFGRPAFPVDTHVHRVGQRIGFLPQGISAEKAHPVMEAIVPPAAYYEFHILMILHGRSLCGARKPLCGDCPVAPFCDYYTAPDALAAGDA
jgi:endonuclease III